MAVCEAGRSLVAPPLIAHKFVVSGRKPPDRDSVSASPDLPFADTFPTQFAAPTVRAGGRGSCHTEVATCSTSLSGRIPSPTVTPANASSPCDVRTTCTWCRSSSTCPTRFSARSPDQPASRAQPGYRRRRWRRPREWRPQEVTRCRTYPRRRRDPPAGVPILS